MEEKKKKIKKIPYHTPVLRTIELAAEEVLAVGCKMISSAGPNKPSSCIVTGSCYTNGS